MKVKNVTYSKVFPLGGYSNEKLGVEIELGEGDDPQKAMQDARNYVEFNHKVNGLLSELEKCDYVLNNPDEFTGNAVKQAKQRKSEIIEQINNGQKLLAS